MTGTTRKLVVCLITCLAVTERIAAQNTTDASPEFEAADIHASAGLPAIHLPAPNSTMRGGLRPGRYELQAGTMLDLIAAAYGVAADKVVGGPAWLNTDKFDLVAKPPVEATQQSVRLMLRNLLADRFGLTVHNDTRPFAEYVLTAGTHRRMELSTGGESGCTQTNVPGTIQSIVVTCHNVTMADFANRLPGLAADYFEGNPVADRTGVEGSWNFTIKWTRRNWFTAAGIDGISPSEAIEKQLGLKLEMEKFPTPVLVVDRVNRKPSENPPGTSQRLPSTPAGFEIADIRPTPPESIEKSFRSDPGGRVELRGFTLAELIKLAWEIADTDVIDNDDMLVGAPRWPERFDIVARAATASPQTAQRLDVNTIRLYLRSLLTDRFQLKTHTTQQPVSVFALVAVKPRLKKADPSNRPACRNAPAPAGSQSTFSIVCRNMTMAQLAEGLPAYGGIYIPHPVIDQTGLEGGWDFTLSWSPPHLAHGDEAGLPSDPNGSLTIVEALAKQLGLKLEPKKYPMPVLVIDHAERKPTEN